jgi:putative redox protein
VFPFEKIQVEVKGELDLRGFFNLANVRPGFDKITLQTKVITDEKDTEKLKQLEHLAKNNCPVLDIIQNQITVNDSIEFVVD